MIISLNAPEIRNFEGKLRNYFLHSGIFVAIQGYTGNKKEGAVGQSMLRFKQEGLKIFSYGRKRLRIYLKLSRSVS
jgi:hypothetical protein